MRRRHEEVGHLGAGESCPGHFSAPKVRPFTINGWPTNIKRIAGMVARTDAAAISPCWISYCWANLAMATGTVAVGDAVRFNATENSFQLKTKARIPRQARQRKRGGPKLLDAREGQGPSLGLPSVKWKLAYLTQCFAKAEEERPMELSRPGFVMAIARVPQRLATARVSSVRPPSLPRERSSHLTVGVPAALGALELRELGYRVTRLGEPARHSGHAGVKGSCLPGRGRSRSSSLP